MPDELALVTRLMLLRFGERAAWDMPLGRAAWYAAMHAAHSGADLDWVDDSEEILPEKAELYRQAARAHRARQGGGGAAGWQKSRITNYALG
jgi:hypothetical protein